MNDYYTVSKKDVLRVGDIIQFAGFNYEVTEITNGGFIINSPQVVHWGGVFDRLSKIVKKKIKKKKVG